MRRVDVTDGTGTPTTQALKREARIRGCHNKYTGEGKSAPARCGDPILQQLSTRLANVLMRKLWRALSQGHEIVRPV
jgi:hypothetical protein